MGGKDHGRKERSKQFMSGFFSRMNVPKRAALVLGLLGIGAAILGNPYKGAKATVDTADLAAIVQREVDHVAPDELADWIIKGRSDFRLIDLRTEAEYNQYHIPGAENVPLTSLADYGIERNEKVILYSEGGIHSAQAWFLLKARQYKGVYILRGGLDEWKEKVLFPAIAADAAPEQQKAFEKMKQVSAYFGGTPQSGSTTDVQQTTLALPKIEAPAAPSAAGKPAKKKKEGC
jgi:sulfur-carrier protein adenylyltransferase/sulfurtransferase